MTGRGPETVVETREEYRPQATLVYQVYNENLDTVVGVLTGFLGREKRFVFIQIPRTLARLPFYLPGCKLIKVIGCLENGAMMIIGGHMERGLLQVLITSFIRQH